jgi:hypothetical protein
MLHLCSQGKAMPLTAKQIHAILPFLRIFQKPGYKCGEWHEPESAEPNHFFMSVFAFTKAVESFVQPL